MRRREFLAGAVGAGFLAGQSGSQNRVRARESLAYLTDAGLWIWDLPEGRPQLVAAAKPAPKQTQPSLEWTGMAAPRISPSGEWIAYQQESHAHVVSRGGGDPKVLGEGAARWRCGRDELFVEETDGLHVFTAANGWSGPVRMIPDAGLPVVFSPDGGEMVYSRREEHEEQIGDIGQLWRVDADAALPPKMVVSRRNEGPIPYAWVGDSVWYWADADFSGSAQCDGLELFRVPAAGGEPHSLGVTTLLQDDFLGLSPAGDRLAAADGEGRESWENKRIALVDRSSGAVRHLTDEHMVAICPSWSPDGTRIAFVSLPEGLEKTDDSGPERVFLGQRRIWVADADGGSPPVRLTGDDRYRDEEPIWLADGRHLLFCRIERGGKSGRKSLWLMDERGGGAVEIAGPLQVNDTFEGEYWFGYYGTIDWPAVLDYHRGGQ